MEFKGVKWSLGGMSGRMIKTNQYGGFVADVDTKVNAQLISKAPEMLEMLKELVRLLDEIVRKDDNGDATETYYQTINKAEKLIKETTELSEKH